MKNTETKRALAPRQRDALIGVLQARFESHLRRHEGIEWAKVIARLDAHPDKLWSLNEMEQIGRAHV